MKRIRLTIGGVALSTDMKGDSLFYLCREDASRCLAIQLTPPQMHSILTAFSGNDKEVRETIHSKIRDTLSFYGVEVLEVVILRDEASDSFVSQILYFDGQREFYQSALLADGVILARMFAAPIYIDEALANKYSVVIDKNRGVVENTGIIANLEKELQVAVDNEDYDLADKIFKRIKRLKGKNHKDI